jgi:hypothetical protein
MLWGEPENKEPIKKLVQLGRYPITANTVSGTARRPIEPGKYNTADVIKAIMGMDKTTVNSMMQKFYKSNQMVFDTGAGTHILN